MTKGLLIFAGILIIIVLIALFVFGNGSQLLPNGKTVTIKDQTIQLEIADSNEKKEKGLSQRKSLPQNRGMLFTFLEPGAYPFWMKDMRFPIDIIYLNSDKVVTIYENVQPQVEENGVKSPNLTLYTPKEPANRVLEINGGLSKKYGLKEGDTIQFKL